ncbi:MAG: hypothetical protein ACKODX_01470, partial [Gemmata sp.]
MRHLSIREPGLVVLAAALLAVPAAAQPPQPPAAPPVRVAGGGTDLFRALLHQKGIEPVKHAELFNRYRPDANTIFVVLGTVAGGGDWDESLRRAREAVAAGGAALVATDSPARMYDHTRQPGDGSVGWFDGGDVTADWTNPEHTFRELRDCPYVVPVSPDELPDAPERPGR